MKNNNYLDALYDVFLRTGDPLYLNMYSILREKENKKRNGRRKM